MRVTSDILNTIKNISHIRSVMLEKTSSGCQKNIISNVQL